MRIPTATYRIQLGPSFGFHAAKGIAGYLSALGISDVYVSSILRPRKGSEHGYDVVDPNEINPELGKSEDLDALMRELQTRGIGWIQDIIPNHMAFDYENAWLMDVLENGECSEYFRFFDIEWDHPYEGIKGRLLAPFLGRFYGECLEDGEIRLQYDEAGFSIAYFTMRFPLEMESYQIVLTHELAGLKGTLGPDDPDLAKLLGVLYALETLRTIERADERRNQIRTAKKTLRDLYENNPEIRAFVDANVEAFNGRKGNPASFNLLDHLLSEQVFRLSFWKVASEEINYRRFFNINELISLRIQEREVFEKSHSLIFKLVDEGKITGLRVDHIDGLYDPTRYLRDLRERAGEAYITVEKILGPEEELPAFWPVQGTTGYDFLNYVNGIFCRQQSEKPFDRIYARFTDFPADSYESLVTAKKLMIMGKYMAGDIDYLSHVIKGVSSRYRHGRDITLYALKRALVEVMTQFPVYRTYLSAEDSREGDTLCVKEAVRKATETNPGLLHELNFIRKFLLPHSVDSLSEEERKEWIHFVMRFQQFTGPLMAKGFEDTVLYVYNRLISMNEVGGNPKQFGIAPQAFHRFSRRVAEDWPHTMNATSTHDTKRGEDVRARINILSEIPEEWWSSLKRWSRLNRRKKRSPAGVTVPDRNDEYFLYQTLLGAFPFDERDIPEFVERLKKYIVKAVREAKVHTAWLKPDTDYEDAFLAFIEDILQRSERNRFLRDFLAFERKVAYYGMLNGLSMTLLKITAPGVPDFYQGTELWDLNLVDPDNRRPVDFEKRRAMLDDITGKAEKDIPGLLEELHSTMEDGRIKLFLISRALRARQENAEVFQKGGYFPLETGGKFKECVVAFAREHGGVWAVTIVPRFPSGLVKEGELPLGAHVWNDTHVVFPGEMPSAWQDAVTGRMIEASGVMRIGDALGQFPVSLLLNRKTGTDPVW
jgi:(1->4)-alpha-D-glucan 1-alpha-D-glucosylmutase